MNGRYTGSNWATKLAQFIIVEFGNVFSVIKWTYGVVKILQRCLLVVENVAARSARWHGKCCHLTIVRAIP